MAAPELKPSEIEQLRRLLRDRQRELDALLDSAQTDSRPVTLDQQSVGRVSRIDAIQQQQMAIASRQQAGAQLRAIEQALRRIADGDYGDCEACGATIAFARLQAQPFARRCVDCQAADESST